MRKELRRVGAENLLDYALDRRLESFEEVFQREVISFEHATGVTLDHRQTGAVQDWCRRSIEHAIDFGSLREVRDLRGAAVVRDCRQQVVLDHRAQRDVRAKSLRLFL